ncbi:flagellar FlbD family protein [Alicyclobacillus ferrooxydans]|uniref:Flagellar protein FlbD n=1 Tax=Alicyclobacillus ferrooxydans TaxID=471514 RepID=A0A0P9D4J6_9BACL|nr:flagellar FlbD family protein [Alicyclobacillus ferrooxydans]KPV44382.1 hypothetical protein AN477_07060 [Alicyclobacillus ferrooxydans]
MIKLTKLNAEVVWVNPLIIENVIQPKDTILSLTNGHKYMVQESPEEIIEKCVQYLTRIGLTGTQQTKSERT